MRFTVIVLIVFSITWWSSCEIINPDEKVPTYIHVDSFSFVSTPHTGTSSHKITNVAAYVDYAPVGIFDLPANIPVLADKPVSIMLIPAVLYSGLSDMIVPYPFYMADTFAITPSPGQRITLAPSTQYFGDSLLTFTSEDFESGNSFVNLEGEPLKRTSDPQYVFEGSYSGIIEVKDSFISTNIMSVPFQASTQSSDKSVAYLELNYKGTLPFVIGLQTTVDGSEIIQYLYGFNARNNWNKVYVGLDQFLNRYQNKSYRVVVQASRQNGNSGYVAFDNFKIVTRK